MKLLRSLFLPFLIVAATMAAAWSMSQSSIPAKFNIPWGNAAGVAYIRAIPQSSQIGIQNCAASLTDGFPPLTFTPSASGGCPPFGQDFNGILKQITQWSQWQAAGGPVFYDSAFSSTIGGYPKGAVVQSSILVGRMWFNTSDNNTTSPDDQTGASANWIALPGTTTAGTPVAGFSTTAPPNTVSANGLTVGNASSNATSRANADTFWLFSYLWNNCASCSLFNSAGGGASKGASAVADWSTNHAIQTINLNGTGLIGADSQAGSSSSNLSGVPVISGSSTVPGSFVGENLHLLTAAQIPSISSSGSNTINVTTAGSGTPLLAGTNANISAFAPSGSSGVQVPGSSGSWANVTGMSGTNTINVVSTNTGGASHNVVERSALAAWWLSL